MFLEMRIAACACMLAAASIYDMKSREIPDKIWLVFGGIGVLLMALEFAGGLYLARQPFVYVAGMGIMSLIGYAAYRAGLFGGADAKALTALAVLFPEYSAGFRMHDIPALSILSNALILSMAGLLHNMARNAISLARGVPIFEGIPEGALRKALAFSAGFSTASCGKYLFAMEETDEKGRRKFNFNPASYGDFAEPGQGRVWVTQALPFIVYIAAGFAIFVAAGDLLALAARAVLPPG
jgi:preflagellin peptidase FlaK